MEGATSPDDSTYKDVATLSEITTDVAFVRRGEESAEAEVADEEENADEDSESESE